MLLKEQSQGIRLKRLSQPFRIADEALQVRIDHPLRALVVVLGVNRLGSSFSFTISPDRSAASMKMMAFIVM